MGSRKEAGRSVKAGQAQVRIVRPREIREPGRGNGGVLLRSREKWSENQRSVRFSPPCSGLFKISGAYSCLKSPQPPFCFLLHRSRRRGMCVCLCVPTSPKISSIARVCAVLSLSPESGLSFPSGADA
ncbi:hypothetical protein E2320_017239 [Naja naja]|nr:hypothetical protein E2320_017239 [Naja naja]